MKTWQEILFGIFLGLAGSAAIILIAVPPRSDPVVLPPLPTPGSLMVHISGAVKTPGVVTLPKQSRILNAVESAGGFTDDADQDAVNLAARVTDGEKIYISSKSDTEYHKSAIQTAVVADPKKSVVVPTNSPIYPININTASVDELQNLPNIGATRAAQIIQYRQDHGPFLKIDDIQNVPGIGPSTFEKLKDLIIVDD